MAKAKKHTVVKFCDTCSCWEFVYDNGFDKMGQCDNLYLDDKVRLNGEDDRENEEVTRFTAATFGCIYHDEGMDLTVLKIDPYEPDKD